MKQLNFRLSPCNNKKLTGFKFDTNVSGNGLKKATNTDEDKRGHSTWNNIYN